MGEQAPVHGQLISDHFCLDDDEDICMERFQFYEVHDFDGGYGGDRYKAAEDSHPIFSQGSFKYDGVIPFNNYNTKNHPNQRIVNMLDFEDVLFNYTVHFDFNFPSFMFKKDSKHIPTSKVFFNGINARRIRYALEDGEGVVWNKNTEPESTWKLNITDFKWREDSMIHYTFPKI